MEKRFEQIFHQRYMNDQQEYEQCLIPVVIGKMHFKTTRHHYTPLKRLNIVRGSWNSYPL